MAIIPARSGSKRIRDKNIHPFVGRPLMSWIIRSACESGVFDEVFVSTDSEAYAAVARSAGASVPFLRDAAADDFSTVSQVVLHELDRLEAMTGRTWENVSVLQATCPLCRSETIRAAYEEFASSGAEALLSCFRFGAMNPWWAFSLEDGRANFILSSPEESRSQDRPPLYCPSGTFAFAKSDAFRRTGSFYGEGARFFPVEWKEGLDIDEPEDLKTAELLFRAREWSVS